MLCLLGFQKKEENTRREYCLSSSFLIIFYGGGYFACLTLTWVIWEERSRKILMRFYFFWQKILMRLIMTWHIWGSLLFKTSFWFTCLYRWVWSFCRETCSIAGFLLFGVLLAYRNFPKNLSTLTTKGNATYFLIVLHMFPQQLPSTLNSWKQVHFTRGSLFSYAFYFTFF